MNLKLNNTETIVVIDGVPSRAWIGENENGVKVTAFISRICVEEDKADQFEKEIKAGIDAKVKVTKTFII